MGGQLTDDEGTRWLRAGEVARLWGVHRGTVAGLAERMGVRTLRTPGKVRTQTRYHADDVERAYREMQDSG